MQWRTISECLLYMRLNSKYTKLLVIVAYVPTNDADEEEKDQFYSVPQAITDNVPRRDILTGDFNARVDRNNKGRESVVGQCEGPH